LLKHINYEKSIYLFRLILLLFVFGTLHKSYSQNTLDKAGLTGATPAAAAYSLRQLSSTYNGPLVRITIGTNYYDVYPDASANSNFSLTSKISAAYTSATATATGATANALSTVVTGTTNATVAIWYDQSGNGLDALQATTANQPSIITTGSLVTQNSKPAIKYNLSNSSFLSIPSLPSSFGPQTNGGTVSAAVTFNTTNSFEKIFDFGTSNSNSLTNGILLFRQGSSAYLNYMVGNSIGDSTGNIQYIQAITNGIMQIFTTTQAAGSYYGTTTATGSINGVVNPSSGTPRVATAINRTFNYLGKSKSGSPYYDGWMSELIFLIPPCLRPIIQP